MKRAKKREASLKYGRDGLLRALKRSVEDNRERMEVLATKYGTEVLDWIPEAWTSIEGVECDGNAEIDLSELEGA